jgi:hypothetical protein
MKTSRESATYLYCLVQAARRPSVAGAPRGLPGTGGLRLLQAASDLWLVATDAPLQHYGGAPIERGLRDLDWVALRGAAHARVVEHFARRRTTLPMKLFTLFTEDARALADVGAGVPRIRRVLDRVAGRQEWGVRVRLDAQLARRTLRRRPSSGADGAQAGTRFLMRKKHERDAAQALLREGRAAVEDAFEALSELADASRRRPGAELEGTRLLLDAALLVPTERGGAFKRTIRRLASALRARGYRLELTGPWPPYTFVADAR